MYRNRLISLLWGLLLAGNLLTACTDPQNRKPDDLIDEDKMAAILTEVHMAEAQVSRLGLSTVDSSNMAYKHEEARIFRKFGVDTATYRTSYIFYSSHPQDMESIYREVVANLQKKIDQKDSLNHKPTKKP